MALNISDCVSLLGRVGSMVGASFRNLGKFVYPTLPVSFGGDAKNRWSFPPVVSAMRSKRSHTGVNV